MQAVTTRNERYGELHVDSPLAFAAGSVICFPLYCCCAYVPVSQQHEAPVMESMLLILQA